MNYSARRVAGPVGAGSHGAAAGALHAAGPARSLHSPPRRAPLAPGLEACGGSKARHGCSGDEAWRGVGRRGAAARRAPGSQAWFGPGGPRTRHVRAALRRLRCEAPTNGPPPAASTSSPLRVAVWPGAAQCRGPGRGAARPSHGPGCAAQPPRALQPAPRLLPDHPRSSALAHCAAPPARSAGRRRFAYGVCGIWRGGGSRAAVSRAVMGRGCGA